MAVAVDERDGPAVDSEDATPEDGDDHEDRHSVAADNASVLRHRRRHPPRSPSGRHIAKPSFRCEAAARRCWRLFLYPSAATILSLHRFFLFFLLPFSRFVDTRSFSLSLSHTQEDRFKNRVSSMRLDRACLHNGKCGETSSRSSSQIAGIRCCFVTNFFFFANSTCRATYSPPFSFFLLEKRSIVSLFLSVYQFINFAIRQLINRLRRAMTSLVFLLLLVVVRLKFSPPSMSNDSRRALFHERH